jgi:DNA-binding CsgD family transcriptional regulator
MNNTSSCGATALDLDGSLSATDSAAGIRQHRLSLVVVNLCDLTVCDISWSALRQLRATPAAVIGRSAAVALPDGDNTARALELMREGTIDFYRGNGVIGARAFTVGDRHIALVETGLDRDQASSGLTPYLGRDHGTIVYTTTNLDLVVRSMSNDIEELLGLRPAEFVGRSFLRALDQEDTQVLLRARGLVDRNNSVCFPLRLRMADGSEVRLRGVLTCLGTDGLSFLFARDDTSPSAHDVPSVRRLEQHLRNIADEVEASGVLTGEVNARVVPHFPGLTGRQSEVLSRLMQGQRVRTIADALYISESTVRNHLSAIFEHFGVHTQAELLDVVVTDLPRRRES